MKLTHLISKLVKWLAKGYLRIEEFEEQVRLQRLHKILEETKKNYAPSSVDYVLVKVIDKDGYVITQYKELRPSEFAKKVFKDCKHFNEW